MSIERVVEWTVPRDESWLNRRKCPHGLIRYYYLTKSHLGGSMKMTLLGMRSWNTTRLRLVPECRADDTSTGSHVFQRVAVGTELRRSG